MKVISTLPIHVHEVEFFVRNMFTRFPFKYGIASLTGLPHVFARVRVTVGNKEAVGLCGEHLPPKWFTKNPNTRYEEDLPDLIRVVTHAGELARGARADSYFAFWRDLYDGQASWAKEEVLAPLLANLGVSMIERAVMDAICRATGTPFSAAIRCESLGMDYGNIRRELAGLTGGSFLAEKPLQSVIARHTVGLGDPLTESDLPPDTRLEDGLPHTLEDCIATYGYTHYKIKLGGNLDHDKARLRLLAELFKRASPKPFYFTLDANENFRDIGQFVTHWDSYHEDAVIRDFMKSLLFVEQPVHRDVALDAAALASLQGWENRPAMIIDESDATLDSLPEALALGYQGTSHKNCKGIVKGLANAALLAKHRSDDPNKRWILSAEDLSNVPPLSLGQDLCVIATLGIDHVERNGHHYFKGASAYPAEVQEALLQYHPDLYHRDPKGGFATVTIQNGRLSTASITATGFGMTPLIDVDAFTPLADWDVGSLNL